MIDLPYKIILASKSPRRQELLTQLGIPFESRVKEVDENFPTHLKKQQVALFLSEKKAKAFIAELQEGELLITSDTIVCKVDKIYNKALNKAEAVEMLQELSGTFHEVITAICLSTKEKQVSFYSSTKVYFKELLDDEIVHYIDNYQPFDKAGAYGIQEWIGMIGIHRIEGSYYNVMGLPVDKLYAELKKF